MPPNAILRSAMYDNLRGDLGAGITGCHSEFGVTGQTHAALALFEAMSEVSEERIFAAWEDGNGETIWHWLRTGKMYMHGAELSDIEDLSIKIIHLANACGMWWADFEYAVQLADWISEHGAAPGVSA